MEKKSILFAWTNPDHVFFNNFYWKNLFKTQETILGVITAPYKDPE